MSKYLILFLFLSTLIFTSAYSQKERAISFELAGSGGFGSFNYERNLFFKSENEPILDELMVPKKIGLRLDLRFGFSCTPIDKNNGLVLVFPIMLHAIKSKGDHGIDFGLGQAVSITTKGNFFILMPASIGYRYQPLDKKYYLRFSYTPLISYLVDFQYQHWAGVTFGYRLKMKE